MNSKSNWYVITGGFSSGKSTTLKVLERLGYRIGLDYARDLIDDAIAKGIPATELRKDERAFQRNVLARKMAAEAEIPKDQLLFMHNAVPCSVAYFELNDLDPGEAMKVCERDLYRKVFLMAQLPYKRDYARVESEEFMRRLNEPLRNAYISLGYEVIEIPIASPEDRASLILKNLD